MASFQDAHRPGAREVLRAAVAMTWGSVVADVVVAEVQRREKEEALAAVRRNGRIEQLTTALMKQLASEGGSDATRDQ